MKLLITCEHGGNHVPKPFIYLFQAQPDVLNSHQGFDLGALDVFEALKPLADGSKVSKTSRLLIELNRSMLHPQLFSKFSKGLSVSEKLKLLERDYRPYRNFAEKWIKKQINHDEEVVHISIHSFTPQLNNELRHCDIGWLYDPKKIAEKMLCKKLKQLVLENNPELTVRFNYPYLGTADGFTTSLRKLFPEHYVGIELEVNQKYASATVMDAKIKNALYYAVSNLELVAQH